MNIDENTECWFCRRRKTELAPSINKLIESDIDKETELKKKHPNKLLLFSYEDIFRVVELRKGLEIPVCWICEEVLGDIIAEKNDEFLKRIIEKLESV